MSSDIFFKKKIIQIRNIFPENKLKNFKVNNIRPLISAKKNDLTFFDTIKYRIYAKKN